MQCDEREKVSEIKRGNHPHRICKRRPQPDDNEIVTFLDGNYSTRLKERCKNGKLTKGELRDIEHKSRKGYSGQRIKVHDYGSKHHYDPRIDIASTKPSECNRELQRLLQDVILPKDYEDIKEHQSNSIKGVEQRHISKGIDLTALYGKFNKYATWLMTLVITRMMSLYTIHTTITKTLH